MSEKMSSDTNALNWFEIPATDIVRAQSFYETIFDIKMHNVEMGDMKMAGFPADSQNGKSGGAVTQSKMHVPSATGAFIYLNANPDLDNVLAKVEQAGGKVVMPKTSIGGNGFMAFMSDSEGNTVGLHSTK